MARRRSPRRRLFSLRPGKVALLLVALAAVAYWLPARPLQRWWSERQGLVQVEAHAPVIRAAALESRVDPNLLAGVMMVESRGHVDARSKVGALGLFQLMLPTAAERAGLLGLSAPSAKTLTSDAALNARLGADYLAWLLARYDGDEERALIAYNAGPGRLKRWMDEAGSYAAWRDARERAGNSDVLAYARRVQDYRQRFADRGVIAPTAVRASRDAAAAAADAVHAAERDFVGPPSPTSQQ